MSWERIILSHLALLLCLVFNVQAANLGRQEDGNEYSWAIDSVNRSQIRDYLRELAKEPHLAGLDRDEWLAGWIADVWRDVGLDEVRVESYNVLLDYPNKEKPNFVKMYDDSGSEIWRSHYKEEGVDDPNFIDAFNAYSKNGTVSGQPVYVNFGTIEDFKWLEENYGGMAEGKICLARYGQIFRGNKADNAANFGCKGLVIFMDPSMVAQNGTDEANLFPNTFWMPGTAVQRGSLALSDGDPQTPNWPSIDHAYRLDAEDRAQYLPSIQVQPIGYTDAYQILSRMSGPPAPADWQGDLNITYLIGGGFVNGGQLEIEVHNELKEKYSSNVIGVIYGSEEPDRYVMLGNHRDAWGFGALDPNSGTAQMMEVARVLGQSLKDGWRPRRTIMFLSWGAEEYSLCGSREFVEQYEMELSERGVAYINTDVCMSGPILEPVASPTLMDLLVPATKDIQSPVGDHQSYYEYWKEWSGQGDDFNPEVSPFVGAGSDHATFLFYAGVPVMDIMFLEDKKLYPNIGGYPGYHTGFETLELVENIYDPQFTTFRACAQLNLRIGLQLAETEKLPHKMENYADVMEEGIEMLENTKVIERLNNLGIDTQYFNESVYAFRSVAKQFDLSTSNVGSDVQLRVLNDQMRGFERTLLLYEGLPDRLQYRHVVTAPSLFDAYGGSAFPGIGDLLYKLDKTEENSEEHRLVVKQLKKHVSDLMIITQRAAHYLRTIPLKTVHSNVATLNNVSFLSMIAFLFLRFFI